MKSITLITSLLIASIAVGEDERQPLKIGKIVPKSDSTESSKEKPQLKIGKLVPSDQDRPKVTPEKPRFPKHWGHPPRIQTRDMVELPGKFGKGSSTLAKWIADNLKRDANKERPGKEEPNPQPKPKPKPKPPPPRQPPPWRWLWL